MPVDSDNFKNVLAHFASGVTVVTTHHEETPIGVTVSAFSSVSLEPPLILICLAKRLFTHEVITKNELFAVNILSAQQQRLGEIFAGMHPDITDRFADMQLLTAETGAPIIEGAIGWLDCRLSHTADGGDHTIFVANVVAAGTGQGDPLLYFDRNWRGLA